MASPLDVTDCVHTVLHLPDELLGLSQSFLGGGEFGLIAPVVKGSNLHTLIMSVMRRSQVWKVPPLPFRVQELI